jgi:ribosomal protein L11 methyltransferase
MAGNDGSVLTRLDIFVPEPAYPRALGLLAAHVSFGWEEQDLPDGRTILRLYTDSETLLAGMESALEAIPGVTFSRSAVARQDWSSAWRDYFTPVEAGNFLGLPPWLAEERTEKQRIIIDPKSAFGTGHHASTVLCLEALSRLFAAGFPARVRALDLGTGTGILGIACATLGCRAIGVDVDPVAVSNALENIALNHVQDRMSVRTGDITAIEQGETFGIVLANILAGPLREMAGDVVRLLAPGGRLILSGILDRQADDVAGAYAALGRPARHALGEWVGLVW